MKKAVTKKTPAQETQQEEQQKPISQLGIHLLAIGFGVMVLGFILMIGGGSDDPNRFSYAIFDFQRTVLSPLVILAGVAIVIVGIMYKPKKQ